VNAPERLFNEVPERVDSLTTDRLLHRARAREMCFASRTAPETAVSLRASWSADASGRGLRPVWISVPDPDTPQSDPSADCEDPVELMLAESCRIAAKSWFELALEVVRCFLSSSKIRWRGHVVAEGGHMHAKEILEHCLECDKAWSEGYTAGYRSVSKDAVSSVPKRPTEPSGVTDRLRYFYDLGCGQGADDAKRAA